MKILHIIPDDKFWQAPVNIFGQTECENEFVCVVSSDCKSFSYIATDKIKMVQEMETGRLWMRSDVDVFMFHSLSSRYYDYVLSVPKSKKVIVASWGFDIYYSQEGCPPIIPLEVYKPMTKRLMQQVDRLPVGTRLKRKIKEILHKKKYLKIKEKKERNIAIWTDKQKKVIERIDYFSSVLPIEYEMMKTNPSFRAEYFPFQYTGRHTADKQIRIDVNKANDILLGNSAGPSNNHLDVLHLLKERKINNKLYVPMAYGEERYRKCVEDYLLANKWNCFIQKEMMLRADYIETLSNCRVGVFGHVRQQSLGNVVLCLLQGSKVFLYKDSVAYKYFKSIGCIVFSIDDELTQEAISAPLSEDEIQLNKSRLEVFTIDVVMPKLTESLRKIECSMD